MENITKSMITTWNNKASKAVATQQAAGLMSAADKKKLDNFAGGTGGISGDYVVNINGKTGVVTLSKSDVGLGNVANIDTSNPENISWTSNYRTVTDTEKTTWNGKASTAVATTSANGLMSSTDKTKLDGITAGANNYTHPASGVSAGSYTKVTVDTNGHVTVGASLSASDIPSHDHTSITGNAATATKLQTAREINGVRFDGSANITLPVATISADGLMSATDKATLDSISLTAGNTISYESVNIAANVSATIASLKRQSCKIQVVAYGQSPTTVNTTGRYVQSPYIDMDNGTEGCIYEFRILEISKASYQWALSRGVNSRDYIGSFNVALIDNGTTLSLIVKPSSAVQVRAVATYE